MAPARSSSGLAAARNDWRPPEAEPHADRATRARALAQRRDGRRRVGLDLLDARLADVRHVLEALVARADAGRAPEVVDGDGVAAGLGEALGQLAVEAVEPAHVWQDDHARAAAPRRLGQCGGEARAVGRGELERLGARATGQRRQRQIGGQLGRSGVVGVAHGRPVSADPPAARRAGSTGRGR
jgi:hypothetical protein